MILWTLCTDRKRWTNTWTLSESDTMGNVSEPTAEDKNSPLIFKNYPNNFLDQFSDYSDKYVLHVNEHEEYDNDDYDIYKSNDRTYDRVITLGEDTVISGGRPVGIMIKSTEYAGGMCNRSSTYGTILFFDKPDKKAGETFRKSCTVWDQNGRWTTRRTYKLVKKNLLYRLFKHLK